MRKTLILSAFAVVTAMGFAAPAFAHGPRAGETVSAPEDLVILTGGPVRRWAGGGGEPATSGITEEELTHYLRRLPTLADLSKERWNEVHRRYDSRRGRREKLRA